MTRESPSQIWQMRYSPQPPVQCGELTEPLGQKYTKMIRKDDSDIAADEPMPPDYLAAFADLWADAGVQFAMEKGNEYALQDNLS